MTRTKRPDGPRIRQQKIADFVRKQGRARVEDLAGRFRTSHETIRRDLTALAENGQIQKFHGGAKRPGGDGEGPFRDRMARNAVAKRVIAEKAADLVSPGETLFIDTGSTTLMCADELARIAGLTVITNSTAIATTISDGGRAAAVYLLGGRFDRDNRETAGPMALEQIRLFHADRALLTIGALDAEAGATNFSFDEAQVARAMLDNADTLVVVCDASKFGRTAGCRVCALDRIDDLVTDRPVPAPLEAALAEADVRVH